MTDEQATAVIDSLAKLTEQVETLSKAVEEQKTALAEMTADDQETDVEKTAREAKEAEDAEAARKKQEEENVAAGLNPDGSAKSGDNDQDGAEADEFDPEAELTPEQQAEIDAALEAVELEPAA